ncbi:MAG: hypothetical protein MUP76_03295 [Acidimicrobiia bacterium]|nr:hypothetical protein [Acidimicrobiia bacterium]
MVALVLAAAVAASIVGATALAFQGKLNEAGAGLVAAEVGAIIGALSVYLGSHHRGKDE